MHNRVLFIGDNSQMMTTTNGNVCTERAFAIIMGLGVISAASYGAAAEAARNPLQPTKEDTTKQTRRKKHQTHPPDRLLRRQMNRNSKQKDLENCIRILVWCVCRFRVGPYYEGGLEETMMRREAALIVEDRE